MRQFLQLAVFASLALSAAAEIPTLVPVPQSTDKSSRWYKRYLEKDALVKKGGWKVVFLGDSITQGWEGAGKVQWEREFEGAPYSALNLGFSGDRTENVAWRIEHGELDGYEAKAIVLMIGTNSVRKDNPLCPQNPAIDRILGVRDLLRRIRVKQPKAKVILCAVFPRGPTPTNLSRQTNAAINREIQKFCDGKTVFWCDFTDQFLNPDGSLSAAMMPDYLHPAAPGYEIWSAAVKPFLNYALTAKEGDLPFPQLFRGSADSSAFLSGKPSAAIPQTRIGERDGGPGDWWLDRVESHRGEILNSKGEFDLVFLGDSITHNWEVKGRGKTILAELCKTYSILNLGYGGDRTQHLLWRIRYGELDNYKAKLVMLMIGTNNRSDKRREDVVEGVKEILGEIARRQPEAKVVLMPIFPRGRDAKDVSRQMNEQVNEKIRAFADGQRVIWCDINAKLVNKDGSLDRAMMPDLLHPSEKGYVIWRDAVLPYFREVCGK